MDAMWVTMRSKTNNWADCDLKVLRRGIEEREKNYGFEESGK